MHALTATTLDLLERLIGFDTRSSESNLPLIGFVQEYLAGHGIAAHLVHDASGQKANLYATIGSGERGGLCLSGHTDVVPVAGQPWTVEPFKLTRTDTKVLGRGTADMKGFIAAVLAKVPDLVARKGGMPVHLAFSYDEEVGCVGVRGLIDQLAASSIKPIGCIVGEPTGMRVAVAHKGKRGFRCCVRGLAGHSALPHLGVNAVDYAAEFVTLLRRTARDLRVSGAQDAAFDPPYTTVHTGKIKGGVALNVIPDQAELEFEVRNLPTDSIEAILGPVEAYAAREIVGEMRQTFAGSAIEWHKMIDYPALSDETRGAWLKSLACDAAGHDETTTLAFGSEGGLFQSIGIPTVVCGPGSISDAHRADEFVEIAQLSQCLSFLDAAQASIEKV